MKLFGYEVVERDDLKTDDGGFLLVGPAGRRMVDAINAILRETKPQHDLDAQRAGRATPAQLAAALRRFRLPNA